MDNNNQLDRTIEQLVSRRTPAEFEAKANALGVTISQRYLAPTFADGSKGNTYVIEFHANGHAQKWLMGDQGAAYIERWPGRDRWLPLNETPKGA